MALSKTPTFDINALCIACLSEDISGARTNPDLTKIYEELIQEQVRTICFFFAMFDLSKYLYR